MENNTHLGIIGLGNMGSAFFYAIQKTQDDNTVHAFDINSDKKQIAKNAWEENIEDVITKSEIIIIAVKPQHFSELGAYKELFKDKTIVSIMAGISIELISETLQSKNIIRCMPNLGILHESGVVGWITTEAVHEKHLAIVTSLFESMGKSIQLDSEDAINDITALSASGLAYFFYLTKIIQEKAEKLGFSKDQAKEIAEQTLHGSSTLLKQNKKTAKEWQEAVTSKGGTTEAALTSFKNNNVAQKIEEGVDAAKNRAEKLS